MLREFEPSDAEGLFRIYSDPETMRFLGEPPASVEEERRNIENHIENYYRVHGFGLWGVVLRNEKTLVGRCGILLQEVDGEKRPEISYLIDRNFWGKGFAAEAARGVMDIALERFGIDKMIAVVAVENRASIRVAEKCGFEFEKRLAMFKDFGPVLVYSRGLQEEENETTKSNE